MTFTKEEILASYGAGDAARFVVAADEFLQREDKERAASALDSAFALAPDDPLVVRQRASILDELAIREHGLVFRYVPAGTFLMGSERGDPDERPVHPRRLDAYWITDVPISWAAYCRLLGLAPPPQGLPRGERASDSVAIYLHERNKIRTVYCSDFDEDPHEHEWRGYVRANAGEDTYEQKPMVAVAAADGEALARVLMAREHGSVEYALPAEAEWEKAARGGLAGARYAWGDASPSHALCDFDRMRDPRLVASRSLPPNGYGLYGVCGGVWELTSDRYDALAYHRASRGDLTEPPSRGERHVIRGGSFTDCAEAVTVSFRSSHADAGWHARGQLAAGAPNVGFRLVRRRARPDR